MASVGWGGGHIGKDEFGGGVQIRQDCRQTEQGIPKVIYSYLTIELIQALEINN